MQKKHCLSAEEIRRLLVAANVQPTIQRVAICKYVLCEADHPTAEDVRAWSEKHLGQISHGTVYNTLNTLVESGLLRMFRFPHSEKAFYDQNVEDHYHLLEEGTERLVDISPEEVKIQLHTKSNIQVKSIDLIVHGKMKNNPQQRR